MTLTWYTEACLSSAETNGVNDDLDRPFPAESRESNAFIYRLRLYCFSRPALFFKRAPFVRGYGGIVGERDNQLKILLLYVLDKASILHQHSLRPRQLQAQLVDVLSHCSQYTFQFHHFLIRISLPLSLPHSTRMRFRLRT